MQQGKYSIETCKGEEQSTYDHVFYIIEGRKEFVAKTSEYIDSAKREAETEKIIEEHKIPDQT
jgi:DNA replication initiation complex subunit (GINS family)